MPSSSPRFWRALTLTWAAVVAGLTLAPADALPPTPVWELLSFDTAAHAAVFAALALPLRRWWRAAGWARSLVGPVGAAIAYGALIEGLQTLMPLGRHGEWSDLLSDAIGALAGAALAPLLPRAGWALVLCLVGWSGISASAQTAPHTRSPERSALPGDSLRARARRVLAVLTDTAFAGRGYGPAHGATQAAAWVRGQFRALGLTPAGDSAGSYYQHFPLRVNTFPGELGMSIGGQALRPGFDFIPDPACPATRLRRCRISVFDTTLLASADSAARRLRPTSLRRRVLVLRAADEKRLARLPHRVRRWLGEAAAWVVLEPRKLTASLADQQAVRPVVRVLASAWPSQARRVALTVDARLEPAWPAYNVLGYLPGTEPAAADSVLFVTAHYDHLGQLGSPPILRHHAHEPQPAPRATTFFPGANDNATGTAMLLALATALRTQPLRHPVYFIAFGAEEAGLVGSRYCAAHPPVPLRRIRFLLNLDLMGAGEDGLGVVGGTLHPRRYHLLDSLNQRLGAVPRFKPRGRAANSDHFPFAERGVPAFFIYAMGGPAWYHDVQDTADAVPLSRFSEVFGLLNIFLRRLDDER